MNNFLNMWFWPILCGILVGLLWVKQPLFSTAQVPSQPAPVVAPADNKPQNPLSYANAVSKAAPSVVNIYTSKRHPALDSQYGYMIPQQQRQRQKSLGSGVIIQPDGYILTNHHVIADADEILVLLSDGRDTLASVVGSDTESDLAVLKIDIPNIEAISVSDPTKARVGDVVLAIGNPFGFEQTVTQGIISAQGRYGLRINTYENFIQTDAAINPGNSGGALIDTNGHLLGINSAIFSKSGGSEGIGLAIPSDTALKVLRDIVQYGRVIRGWLGIEAQQLAPQQVALLKLPHSGVVVTDTTLGGPADHAGVLPGDIILQIDGQPITDGHTGMRKVANISPGEEISIDLMRGKERLKTTVVTGIRPAQ